MKYLFQYLLLFVTIGCVSCSTTRTTHNPKQDDGKIEIVFVQVNDVYEIAPLEGGKTGGMARVATLKKQILQTNPNTFLVMAGDFVSPSVYNSLQYQGKRIRGRQMIEAMNIAGTDFAIFGNHEFDINENELQERINESTFQWVSSNAFHKKTNSEGQFQKYINGVGSNIPQTFTLSVKDADGTTAKIGFIGLTLPYNKADYVSYADPLSTATKLYNQLKDSVDAIVALTHQFIDDDIEFAKQLPDLATILGGHEHDMRFEKVGNIDITKAHANARSAYVVRLIIDKNTKIVKTLPQLKMLDETVALDSTTNVIVSKWTEIANENYASLGFDARAVVLESGEPLDGRETETRNVATNLTRLIVEAMAAACPDADAAIMHAGYIRVDDILTPPVTQYDIIRALPFGGPIREADIKGSLLLRVLDAGQKNKGIGGFLHFYPIMLDPTMNKWMLKNSVIDPEKIYRVAFLEFLITGKEKNLEFLHKDNPGMIKLYEAETSPASSKSDARLAVIRYLQKKN